MEQTTAAALQRAWHLASSSSAPRRCDVKGASALPRTSASRKNRPKRVRSNLPLVDLGLGEVGVDRQRGRQVGAMPLKASNPNLNFSSSVSRLPATYRRTSRPNPCCIPASPVSWPVAARFPTHISGPGLDHRLISSSRLICRSTFRPQTVLRRTSVSNEQNGQLGNPTSLTVI